MKYKVLPSATDLYAGTENRTVVIVPKRAFKDGTEQSIFENTFKK